MSILILMRHGQSIWNLQNRFTGGIDVPLTRKGIKQAKYSDQVGKNFFKNNSEKVLTKEKEIMTI